MSYSHCERCDTAQLLIIKVELAAMHSVKGTLTEGGLIAEVRVTQGEMFTLGVRTCQCFHTAVKGNESSFMKTSSNTEQD